LKVTLVNDEGILPSSSSTSTLFPFSKAIHPTVLWNWGSWVQFHLWHYTLCIWIFSGGIWVKHHYYGDGGSEKMLRKKIFCWGMLTAETQTIAKNSPKMAQKWPKNGHFLRLKKRFFAADSKWAQKVQIAKVGLREHER